MTRKAGSKNKPKEKMPIEKELEESIENARHLRELSEVPGIDLLKYNILKEYSDYRLVEKVCEAIEQGYICQGGVSVTTYPDGRGGQTFVYCQALVRKE